MMKQEVKRSLVEDYINDVEDLLTKIMTAPLSAMERALVLSGTAASAAGMARSQIDCQIESTD